MRSIDEDRIDTSGSTGFQCDLYSWNGLTEERDHGKWREKECILHFVRFTDHSPLVLFLIIDYAFPSPLSVCVPVTRVTLRNCLCSSPSLRSKRVGLSLSYLHLWSASRKVDQRSTLPTKPPPISENPQPSSRPSHQLSNLHNFRNSP